MPRKTERTLLILLALEIAIFSFTGRNFFSLSNGAEIVRLAVELGLLSLAMTLVIVTGGIDLSVGSLMSLCAVAAGSLWHDAGWPLAAAAFAAILAGLRLRIS